VGDAELLDLLASETDRRGKNLIAGIEDLASSGQPNPERVEELRVDAHGIKGAAMVVGQERLAELAKGIEEALAARSESGEIDGGIAASIVAAVNALEEGTQAAASGGDEPASVEEAMRALGG
jgi:chemotaxis protein histidine kinase CheA